MFYDGAFVLVERIEYIAFHANQAIASAQYLSNLRQAAMTQSAIKACLFKSTSLFDIGNFFQI